MAVQGSKADTDRESISDTGDIFGRFSRGRYINQQEYLEGLFFFGHRSTNNPVTAL